MRYSALLLFLAGLASSGFATPAPPTPHSATVVRVGIYENPPKIFTAEHHAPDGFWVALVQAIATKEGWRIEWVHGTWHECLARLANREIDILPDTGWTPERARRFVFCEEVPLVSWCRLYAAPGVHIESILDLDWITVAGLADSFDMDGPLGLKDLAARFGLPCNFLEMPSYNAIFKALQDGIVQAGLTDGDYGRLNARRYGVKATPVIIQPTRMLFAFPKDSPSTPQLVDAVDSNMRAFKRDKQSIYYRAMRTYLGARKIGAVENVIPLWVRRLFLALAGVLVFLGTVALVSRLQVRRRTAELRASEERFRLAFMTSPDAINLNRLEDGLYVDVNEGFTAITGYTRNEVIGKTSRELSIWADPEDRRRLVRGLEESGKVTNQESRFCLKDGRIVTGLMSASVIKLDGVPHIISITRNIEEMKQTQQALRTSELRYRYLFENSPVSLWEEDYTELLAYLEELYRAGVRKEELRAWLDAHPEALAECARRVRVVDVNAAAVAQSEAESKEELKQSPDRTFTEASFGVFREVVVAIAEGRRSFETEAEKQTLRGQRLEVIVHFTIPPVSGPGSRSNFAVVANVDITALKQAQCELEKSLRELRGLYNLSVRIRRVQGPEAVAREAVAAFREVLRPDVVLFFRAESDHLELLAADTGDTPFDLAAVRRHEFGECLCGRVMEHANPVFSSDIHSDPRCTLDECKQAGVRSFAGLPLVVGGDTVGVVVLGSIEERDFEADRMFLEALTNEVAVGFQNAVFVERLHGHEGELERRVTERTAELEAANRELESFSHSVSHDLRAPLRAIDGFVRILAEDYIKDLDAEARRLIGVVRDNARRMEQLIDDLLDFSRVNRHHIERCTVDMAGLAEAMYYELTDEAQRGRIRFTVRDMPTARADPALMRRVFTNLIANAIKFSARTEIPEVTIGARIESGETRYYVTDNGVGFDMQYAGKLFQVFQRLHGDEEFGGTGIGLSIVERVITRHGGRVWAESEPGRGATFYFTVPEPGGDCFPDVAALEV